MRALALLPMFFAGVCAFAQDWTIIKTPGANIQFAVDLSSLQSEEGVVNFKERLVYEKADKIDPTSGVAIKEKLVHRVMDCDNRTQGMLSGSMRNEAGGLIEMITYDRSQLVMAPIPPGTLAEYELELVCKKSKAQSAK